MTKKVLDKFGIKINENTYQNWSEMHIHTSMNLMAGSFVFMDCDFSRGSFDKWKIKKKDEIKVFVEDETIITGYVDSIPIEYGRNIFNIQFIGRDKTCDLIDCTYNENNNEFKKQTRANIIRRLIQPFGLELTIDSTATEAANVKIDTFKADEGRYICDIIAEICRDAGILPLSVGDGKLTLMKATTSKRAKDPIQYGVNAVYGKRINDDAERFSDYIVKGYGNGGDNKRLEDFIEPSGKFNDSIVTRYRPLTIFADRATDSGKCYDRAKWEARIRAGYSRALVYEVPGWMQSDGSIWKKNTLVTVYDKILDIDADEFIAAEVDYIYEEKVRGAYCSILLVDKDTYSGSASDIDIKTRFDK